MTETVTDQKAPPKSVYAAIAKVQAALAKEGIAKDRTATQGASFKFRGIDDIYNALATLLAEHGLCILPRIIKREFTERLSGSGKPLYFVTVTAEYDFVSSADCSVHTVTVFGEAMDTGDKATNKAMSAAYKYACLQTFCIPTEGDQLPDTEEVIKKRDEEDRKQALGLEEEMILTLEQVTDAASYTKARDTMIPLFLRMKHIAPGTATRYEEKMIELKAKYVTNRPATVGDVQAAKR